MNEEGGNLGVSVGIKEKSEAIGEWDDTVAVEYEENSDTAVYMDGFWKSFNVKGQDH